VLVVHMPGGPPQVMDGLTFGGPNVSASSWVAAARATKPREKTAFIVRWQEWCLCVCGWVCLW